MAEELNVPLIRQIVEAIEMSPGQWDQEVWSRKGGDSCPTQFCFAGWALHLSEYLDEKGRPNIVAIQHAANVAPEGLDIVNIADETDDAFPWSEVAEDLLGFTEDQAGVLFSGWVGDGTWDSYKQHLKRLTGLSFPSGTLDVKTRGMQTIAWTLRCSDCGPIQEVGGTADDHDSLIVYWAEHEKLTHSGNGRVQTSQFINADYLDRMMKVVQS
jgi:hypothetical protein